MTVIRMPTCSKCGCHDIRNLTWHYKCFKCGHVIKHEPRDKEKWPKKEKKMKFRQMPEGLR